MGIGDGSEESDWWTFAVYAVLTCATLTCIQRSNRDFEIISAQLQNCLRFGSDHVHPKIRGSSWVRSVEYWVGSVWVKKFGPSSVAWVIGARADCNYAALKSHDMLDAPFLPHFCLPSWLPPGRSTPSTPSLCHCLNPMYVLFCTPWVKKRQTLYSCPYLC